MPRTGGAPARAEESVAHQPLSFDHASEPHGSNPCDLRRVPGARPGPGASAGPCSCRAGRGDRERRPAADGQDAQGLRGSRGQPGCRGRARALLRRRQLGAGEVRDQIRTPRRPVGRPAERTDSPHEQLPGRRGTHPVRQLQLPADADGLVNRSVRSRLARPRLQLQPRDARRGFTDLVRQVSHRLDRRLLPLRQERRSAVQGPLVLERRHVR